MNIHNCSMPMSPGSIKDMLALYPLGLRNQSVGSWGSVLVMIFPRLILGEQMDAHANQRFFILLSSAITARSVCLLISSP